MLCPQIVTLSGIVKLVRPVQYRKASSPIAVTPSRSVTLSSCAQPEKAPLPILPPRISSSVRFGQAAKRLAAFTASAITTFVSLSQPAKA